MPNRVLTIHCKSLKTPRRGLFHGRQGAGHWLPSTELWSIRSSRLAHRGQTTGSPEENSVDQRELRAARFHFMERRLTKHIQLILEACF